LRRIPAGVDIGAVVEFSVWALIKDVSGRVLRVATDGGCGDVDKCIATAT